MFIPSRVIAAGVSNQKLWVDIRVLVDCSPCVASCFDLYVSLVMIPLERFQDDKIYMQTTRREVAANRLPVDEGILSSRSPPPSYSAENTG